MYDCDYDSDYDCVYDNLYYLLPATIFFSLLFLRAALLLRETTRTIDQIRSLFTVVTFSIQFVRSLHHSHSLLVSPQFI